MSYQLSMVILNMIQQRQPTEGVWFHGGDDGETL